MREIKFRAWDGNRFHHWGFNEDGSFIGPLTNSGNLRRFDSEQFTGLHDKNGREIYEGDIWKACRSVRSEPIEVSWIDGSSGFYPFTEPAQGGYEWEAEEAERGEVIGNIHENPELVK